MYSELVRIFQQADARYNSGLFHFKEEKNASGAADSLTLSLNVDDKVLKEILGSLYYPESPYVFSEIPSDILGQVYERFLGKVIRLTAGHQAKVEEKPEVRKAGGVYYTPTYIVDYIVKNTVGKLLDPTPSPPQMEERHLERENDAEEVSKLKSLTRPAVQGHSQSARINICWIGIELVQRERPGEVGKVEEPAHLWGKDGWELTVDKKKEILLNNIYGVDIDPQAVEVTKLTLLLKVLEG